MTAATAISARDADDSVRDEARENEQYVMESSAACPLPGVMDFLGATVGGELAAARWR